MAPAAIEALAHWGDNLVNQSAEAMVSILCRLILAKNGYTTRSFITCLLVVQYHRVLKVCVLVWPQLLLTHCPPLDFVAATLPSHAIRFSPCDTSIRQSTAILEATLTMQL